MPAVDGDAFGFLRVGIEGVVEEAADEGGFAHAALPDQDEFGLVERAGLSGKVIKPGLDDGLRFLGFFQDFRGKRKIGIVEEEEFRKLVNWPISGGRAVSWLPRG